MTFSYSNTCIRFVPDSVIYDTCDIRCRPRRWWWWSWCVARSCRPLLIKTIIICVWREQSNNIVIIIVFFFFSSPASQHWVGRCFGNKEANKFWFFPIHLQLDLLWIVIYDFTLINDQFIRAGFVCRDVRQVHAGVLFNYNYQEIIMCNAWENMDSG